MGCDIHVHEEVKINGRWEHYALIRPTRNYALFAKMAGMRNYDSVEPLALPRGLPSDVNVLTRFDYDRRPKDWHHASWLSAEEIFQLGQWMKAQRWLDWGMLVLLDHFFGWFFGNPWDGFWKYRDLPSDENGNPAGIEDVRWVFWFDN